MVKCSRTLLYRSRRDARIERDSIKYYVMLCLMCWRIVKTVMFFLIGLMDFYFKPVLGRTLTSLPLSEIILKHSHLKCKCNLLNRRL